MKNKRNAQFKTFGCRLNSFETEVMGKIAKLPDDEDITIINTCAVTNEAVRKAKKTIRKMKRTIYVYRCVLAATGLPIRNIYAFAGQW